jgi:hypothetical protein
VRADKNTSPAAGSEEPRMRAMEKALIERARAAGVGRDFGDLELRARLQHHGAAPAGDR